MSEWPNENGQGKESKDNFERDVINRLAFAALNEQRRTRRWGIFFKALTFIYLFVILVMFMQGRDDGTRMGTGKHTALVDIKGVIADSTDANADTITKGLRNAFEDKNTAGVILRINSPGGSPVQSAYVYDEIRRLRAKYPDTPIYGVVSDVCASGGYYIASATDAIYTNPASLVGSVGVLLNGFGFSEAMKKLGVERRLLSAGENKGFLDPFSPMKEKDVQHMEKLLTNVHRQFIDAVKAGRGDRLKDDPQLFSGLVWSGEKGLELGLVDAFGSAGHVAREVIGEERIVDFTAKPHYLERFASRLGSSIGEAISTQMGLSEGGLR